MKANMGKPAVGDQVPTGLHPSSHVLHDRSRRDHFS
uniref:Uncharacterized protein n=1 Tax=Parascaris univalens TaxID=6257 RepID=A0A914ZQW2_PARUN